MSAAELRAAEDEAIRDVVKSMCGYDFVAEALSNEAERLAAERGPVSGLSGSERAL